MTRDDWTSARAALPAGWCWRPGEAAMSALRLYQPDELGPDGYPHAWHATIKHDVRRAAGNRCVRCGHPYTRGEHGDGEWSPCDEQCSHDGPGRFVLPDGSTIRFDSIFHVTNDQAVRTDAQWRILTVHHLTGCWGREAEAKRDCRWWNLVAVCQRCHLRLQRTVDMHRVWPWEHTEWFRPYVAGYYAHVYLDEDLERWQVEDRLEELLALERAA